MNETALSARSRSASSNTMTGFFPPSSKCTRLSVGAPWAWISDPVADSPTKAMALIAGCSVRLLPADSPRPCTTLSTPGGKPGLECDLGQQVGRERAPFGRLVHDGAAGRQRRRDLPRAQHERRVPGGDHADRADRMAGRVVHVIGRRQRQPVGGGRRPIGEEAEVGGATYGGGRHESHGLARVDTFGDRDLVCPFGDQVGDGVQDALAFGTGCRRPILERRSGSRSPRRRHRLHPRR